MEGGHGSRQGLTCFGQMKEPTGKFQNTRRKKNEKTTTEVSALDCKGRDNAGIF